MKLIITILSVCIVIISANIIPLEVTNYNHHADNIAEKHLTQKIEATDIVVSKFDNTFQELRNRQRS